MLYASGFFSLLLEILSEICHIFISLILLVHPHLFLDVGLDDAGLIVCLRVDQNLVYVLVGVLACHFECLLAGGCTAQLDLGYQFAQVLLHLGLHLKMYYMYQKRKFLFISQLPMLRGTGLTISDMGDFIWFLMVFSWVSREMHGCSKVVVA